MTPRAVAEPIVYPTVADLLERLGGVPAERVWLRPVPGLATEADLLEPGAKLCELIDGTLVEKTRGVVESILALDLGGFLAMFLRRHRLGIAMGPDGMVRLMPGLVRLPDLCFVSWDRLPGRKAPTEPILELAPDLAVEVLSRKNTKAEMTRKVGEYFEAGVRLVWLIDPRKRTVAVLTGVGESTTLRLGQTLDGGEVLPGFALPLAELFECLDRRGD